jgi:cytochrome c oxidase cbb3-type subunit 3
MIMRSLVALGILALVGAGASQAQQAADGAQLYARNCASCHGASGVPNPAMVRSLGAMPDLSDARVLAALADTTIANAITAGKGRGMPAYRGRLTAEQIQAVIAYVRTLNRRPSN